MAVLAWLQLQNPRFSSLFCTASFDSFRRTKNHGIRASVQEITKKKKKSNGVAIVWFKHDLRADDHAALVAASRYSAVVPLYVFDHRILSRFSDETLELVLLALEELKAWFQGKGSDLMIRFGSAETVIPEIVNEVAKRDESYLKFVDSIDVYAEEELEYELRRMIGSVEECLSSLSLLQGSLQIVMWQTPFYDYKNLEAFPTFYPDFEKLKLSPTTPIASPELPQLDLDLDWGSIPTFDDVKEYMDKNPWKLKNSWTKMKGVSPEKILRRKQFGKVDIPNDLVESLREPNSAEINQINSNPKKSGGKKSATSVFLSRKENVVGGGTCVILNALAAYLRYFEGTSRDDWQEVHEKLRDAESRSGSSFYALFGPALSLGIISKRRVHYEALKYEKECNGGFISPFGCSAATVTAAASSVCSMEWYWLMALRSQRCVEQPYSIRIWRWHGHLIQYTVVGDKGPAVLLVHGFGAFLEHYRDNINATADGGNRVWAITLLGFGRSEKPNIIYTELLWTELMRDFIVDVVGEPAHLVGNSIGGYFVAIAAGLWPSLAKSVVLINTAGSIIPGDFSFPPTEARETSGAAWLGSRLLMLYLRLRVGNILKNCYPTSTKRVDDWLIDEMLRAVSLLAYDPGALAVLESIFSFNLSIPLNFLFESFGGKVLIIQGMKDPISKSELRISMFKEHCGNVVIKELDSGHCPHDEKPREVNSCICDWIMTTELKLQPC